MSTHLWCHYISASDGGIFFFFYHRTVCDWFENTNARSSRMTSCHNNFMFYKFHGDHVIIVYSLPIAAVFKTTFTPSDGLQEFPPICERK